MSGMIGALFGSVLEGAGKGMVAAADTQIQRDNAKIAADQKIAMEKRLMAAKMMMEEQAAARAASRVSAITGAKVTEKVAGAATEFDDDGNPTAPNASTNTRDQSVKEQVDGLLKAGMPAEAEKVQRIANGQAVEKYHNDLVGVRKEGIEQKDRSMQAKAELDRQKLEDARLRYFDKDGNLRPSPGIAIADINSYTRKMAENNKSIRQIEKDIADSKYFNSPDKDPKKQFLSMAIERLEELRLDNEMAQEAQRKAIDEARKPASKKGDGGMVSAPPPKVIEKKPTVNTSSSMSGKIKKSPADKAKEFEDLRAQVNAYGKPK